MSRTKEREAEAFEEQPQPQARAAEDEVEETEAESSEGGELGSVPFVGGDAYDAFYEGGVATPGVKPDPPFGLPLPLVMRSRLKPPSLKPRA